MKKEKNKPNIIPKIFTLLLSTLIITNNSTIYADYEVSGKTDTGAGLPGAPCGGDLRGCLTTGGAYMERISFIDSDGNYFKNDITGEELRTIEIGTGSLWKGDNSEGFYDDYTITSQVENNKKLIWNDIEVVQKRLTPYGIKRITNDTSEDNLKEVSKNTINYNDILEIDVSIKNGFHYMEAGRLREYLGEEYNDGTKKLIFNGKAYNFRDLLYIWSHMSISKCNYNRKDTCNNEFEKWDKILENIKNESASEKEKQDYKKFIDNSYVISEPIKTTSPGTLSAMKVVKRCLWGEKCDDSKDWADKRKYYYTAMEFAVLHNQSELGYEYDSEVCVGPDKIPDDEWDCKVVSTECKNYDIKDYGDYNNKTAAELMNEGWSCHKTKYDVTHEGTITSTSQEWECTPPANGTIISGSCHWDSKCELKNPEKYQTICYNEMGTKTRTEAYSTMGLGTADVKQQQFWGLDTGFVQVPAFCMPFISETPTGMSDIIKGSVCETEATPNAAQTNAGNMKNKNYVKYILESSTNGKIGLNSYGLALFKVNEDAPTSTGTPGTPTPTTCKINTKSCENKDNYGKFGLTTNFTEDCVENVETFKAADNVYCYDSSIEYDFTDALDELKKVTNPIIPITVPTGYLKINTKCYVNGNPNDYNLSNLTKPSVLTNKNAAKITLNFVDKNYTFEANTGEMTTSSSEPINKSGYNEVSYIYTIPMKLNPSTFTLSSSLEEKTYTGNLGITNIASINQFSNISKMNSKILNKLKGKTEISESSKTYTLENYDDNNFKCGIETDIEKPYSIGAGGRIPPKGNPELENIKFRVISLSYPFPSKDGNSRLPGSNWLNEKNYVYKYITNNRYIQGSSSSSGVTDPEMIYLQKEPLYTITLDASNMIKIRNYNKTHDYNEMDLRCYNERECLSEFLKTDEYNLKLGGTCKYGGYINIMKYSVAEATGSTEGFDTPISAWDIEKDGYYDSSDYTRYLIRIKDEFNVSDDDATLYTDYYMCAEKDSNSGG